MTTLTFQDLLIGDKFCIKGGPTVYTKTSERQAQVFTGAVSDFQHLDLEIDFYVDARLAIRPSDYWQLRKLIMPLDTKERRQKYVNGEFKHAERTKNVAMRYRWDLTYLTQEIVDFTCHTLYKYLDDDQIDSALRHMLGMTHEHRLYVR